jgi:DNA-binding MarR family transcriptional regulator
MRDAAAGVTAAEYRALARFRYELRRFLSFSEQAARAHGLEPAQHQLLLAVMGMPPDVEPTIGNLAERLLLRHHSVVGLVDRLEERDLARRERQEPDRRQVHIRLTPQGEELLRRLSLDHRAELETSGPALVGALEALLGAPSSHLE